MRSRYAAWLAMPKAHSPQTFLSLDLGLRRTGVAFGTAILQHARSLPTVYADTEKKRFAAIAALLGQWQPEALVLGVPRHPDGQAHEMTQRALRFGRQLRGRFGLTVFEVDERYSSVEAQAQGARDIDAGAAVIILEQFFREYSPPPSPPSH